jgi:hypothetical protein
MSQRPKYPKYGSGPYGPVVPYRIQRKLRAANGNAGARPVGGKVAHHTPNRPRTPQQRQSQSVNIRIAQVRNRYRGGRWK